MTVGDRGDKLKAAYLGFHGDGKWGRLNVNHAFYQAFGQDNFNRLAARETSINAQMAAFEGSIDRDWIRWRGSVFYASGDGDLNDDRATGFDMIQDNPNFAGGPFQFWTQQTTAVGGGIGVLKNKFSLLPNLRNNSTTAELRQPGSEWELGADCADAKLKVVDESLYLRFARAGLLHKITGPRIRSGIGPPERRAKFGRSRTRIFPVTGAAVFPARRLRAHDRQHAPLVSPTSRSRWRSNQKLS